MVAPPARLAEKMTFLSDDGMDDLLSEVASGANSSHFAVEPPQPAGGHDGGGGDGSSGGRLADSKLLQKRSCPKCGETLDQDARCTARCGWTKRTGESKQDS